MNIFSKTSYLFISVFITTILICLNCMINRNKPLNNNKRYVMVNIETVKIKKPEEKKEEILEKIIEKKVETVKKEGKPKPKPKPKKQEKETPKEEIKEEVKELPKEEVKPPPPIIEEKKEEPVIEEKKEVIEEMPPKEEVKPAKMPDFLNNMMTSATTENKKTYTKTENSEKESDYKNFLPYQVTETTKKPEEEILEYGSNEGVEYKLIEEYYPEYPEIAKQFGFTEEVVVVAKILIGLDGRVENVDIEKGLDEFGFNKAVKNSMKRWRFTPIKYKGRVVKAYFVKSFRFKMK